MQPSLLTRRSFCAASAVAVGSAVMPRTLADAAESEPFQLKYILGSCMYGYQYVGEILPEVRKTGATALDVWPKVHGTSKVQSIETRPIRLLCTQGPKLWGITSPLRGAR